MEKRTRVVKRYQNRKLYDTTQSCYVTLDEVSQIMREGEDIIVIDNNSKEDITFMTHIQMLFELEKKRATSEDTQVLKRAIRSQGGTMVSYIKELEAKLEGSTLETETFIPQTSLSDQVQPSAPTLN